MSKTSKGVKESASTESIALDVDRTIIELYRQGKKEEARQEAIKLINDSTKVEAIKNDYNRLFYNFEQLEWPKADIAIFGHQLRNGEMWSPDSVKTGIAGSEEAIINCAQNLVDRGYRVIVFASPPERSLYSLACANPRYVSAETFHHYETVYKIGIVWRRHDFLTFHRFCESLYYWPHDLPTVPIPVRDLSKIKGIFYLSEFHRGQFETINKHFLFKTVPYVISGNGIDLSHFVTEEKEIDERDPYKCIYASNYSRGLELLLAIWPNVYKKFPKATLDIYYGRETYGTMSSEALFKTIKTISQLEDKGVREIGKVSHKRLAKAFMKASIWAYPCHNLSETYCITAIKAQAAGCIPVTSRMGALKETVHPDAPTVDKVETADEKIKYENILLYVLGQVDNIKKKEEIEKDRTKYQTFAFSKTWKACVDKWFTLIKK